MWWGFDRYVRCDRESCKSKQLSPWSYMHMGINHFLYIVFLQNSDIFQIGKNSSWLNWFCDDKTFQMIKGSEHSIIRLTWESFAVEQHSRCSYDRVTVYDGNRLDVPLESTDNSSTAVRIGRWNSQSFFKCSAVMIYAFKKICKIVMILYYLLDIVELHYLLSQHLSQM